jgi:cold shock CspA family protein/ribosome-associated translation inhibitor RaiA
MQTPVQIEFRGFDASEGVRDAVAAHIDELETRFGRITTCRVMLKAPSGRHRVGGQYEVHIRLALPNGREVNVGRTPKADERHSDLTFAIADAFHRARRRLQDHATKMNGRTKVHDDAPVGTVSKLEPIDGYGMLTTADGREIYFHQNSVLNGGYPKLKVGTRVTFAEEMGAKGAQASTVRPLGKHGLR